MGKGRHRQKTRAAPQLPKASARMEHAWRLFDEGDKLRARSEAKAILGDAASGHEADQARELLERTGVPRVALIAAAAATAVLILLILLAIART